MMVLNVLLKSMKSDLTTRYWYPDAWIQPGYRIKWHPPLTDPFCTQIVDYPNVALRDRVIHSVLVFRDT